MGSRRRPGGCCCARPELLNCARQTARQCELGTPAAHRPTELRPAGSLDPPLLAVANFVGKRFEEERKLLRSAFERNRFSPDDYNRLLAVVRSAAVDVQKRASQLDEPVEQEIKEAFAKLNTVLSDKKWEENVKNFRERFLGRYKDDSEAAAPVSGANGKPRQPTSAKYDKAHEEYKQQISRIIKTTEELDKLLPRSEPNYAKPGPSQMTIGEDVCGGLPSSSRPSFAAGSRPIF